MKRSIIIFLLCLAAFGAEAQQTLHSSYFMKRMPMRHKLNPAHINDYGYFSIPMLGNVNLGVQSNLSIKNFLYPTNDGNLMTFMHKDVSANEFIDHVKNFNSVEYNFDMSILSFGFFGFKGYNTFDLSVRSNMGIYVPGDLFRFMKLGMDSEGGNSYHLENFTMKTDNYVELALGHAHKLNDRLTIGAKVKFLAGLANAKARIQRMDITMTQDKWEIMANGQMDASFYGASLLTKTNGEIDDLETDFENPALSGWGLGTDLGATYKLLDKLTLSAALVDVGFIRWNKNIRGVTHNDESFLFDGFTEVDVNDDSDLDDQMDDITDQLEDMIRFYKADAPSARTTSLRSTMNIGAEYALLNDKITFGLLSSTRFSRPKTWTEVMGTVNFRPAKWFNATFSGTLSNYGPNWGWVLNLCPRGFNFFVGTDCMVTRVTPQWIPTKNATVNLNFGFNVPMGGPLRQARKAEKRAARDARLDNVDIVKIVEIKTDTDSIVIDSLQRSLENEKLQKEENEKAWKEREEKWKEEEEAWRLKEEEWSANHEAGMEVPPPAASDEDKIPDESLYTYVPGMKDEGLSWVLRTNRTVLSQAFDFNKPQLNSKGKDFLNALNRVMKKRKDINAKICVFCDVVGTDEVNKTFSDKRADNILRYLQSKGIPASRLSISSNGTIPPRQVTSRDASQNPFLTTGQLLTPEYIKTLAPEQQAVAHALNRRIEVHL